MALNMAYGSSGIRLDRKSQSGDLKTVFHMGIGPVGTKTGGGSQRDVTGTARKKGNGQI